MKGKQYLVHNHKLFRFFVRGTAVNITYICLYSEQASLMYKKAFPHSTIIEIIKKGKV